jgi:hypothetical protein
MVWRPGSFTGQSKCHGGQGVLLVSRNVMATKVFYGLFLMALRPGFLKISSPNGMAARVSTGQS